MSEQQQAGHSKHPQQDDNVEEPAKKKGKKSQYVFLMSDLNNETLHDFFEESDSDEEGTRISLGLGPQPPTTEAAVVEEEEEEDTDEPHYTQLLVCPSLRPPPMMSEGHPLPAVSSQPSHYDINAPSCSHHSTPLFVDIPPATFDPFNSPTLDSSAPSPPLAGVSPLPTPVTSPPLPLPLPHLSTPDQPLPPHSPAIPTSNATEEDVQWSETPPPNPPNFPFSGHTGLKILPEGNEPLDFFNLTFTLQFFQMIVRETNAYAEEIFLRGASERSRISDWKELTVEEVKVFFGLLFHTGIIRVSRLKEYWNKNIKFHNKFFSSAMSRDRFLNIRQCLHFSRNPGPEEPRPNNPLYKVQSLMEYFQDTMENLVGLSRNVCIDESLAPWRGRLSFRQYIPLKTHKYGIKLYVLAEPDGLIHRFLVYAGAKDAKLSGPGHANKVVHELLRPLKNLGYSLFMDNFYNSVALATDLIKDQTFVTGTLRQSRKNNPVEVTQKKLKKGEVVERWSQEGVNVCKWKDKRDVLTISTEFSGKKVNVPVRRGPPVQKPEVIVQYNKNMGGIDRADQYLSYYNCVHRTLKWYKKLGYHIFEIMLQNSYLLYRRYSANRGVNYYDFRLQIIDDLCAVPESGYTPRASSDQDKNILNGQHFPDILQSTESRGGRTSQRRCRVCSKNNIVKRVTTYCPACEEKPGLCLKVCFLKYHKDKGFNIL